MSEPTYYVWSIVLSALTLIAAISVFTVYYCQLKKMDQQVSILAHSERAWVSVEIESVPTLDATSGVWTFGGRDYFTVRCVNFGKTVARIVETGGRFHLIPIRGGTPDIANKPRYIKTYPEKGRLIVPGAPFGFAVPMENDVTPEQFRIMLARVWTRTDACFVYGFIKYRDTLSDKDHITQFGYHFIAGMWKLYGSDEYNNAT